MKHKLDEMKTEKDFSKLVVKYPLLKDYLENAKLVVD
jgi:hypothetical protein